MPLAVDHDVSVVTVFDLQDIASNRVRRHRLNEVQSSLLERGCVDSAVFVNEVSVEIVDFGSSHLVSGCGIRYDINDSALDSRPTQLLVSG